mmetsp:Transcript_38528/g.111285  ORF Transcript_38528/g.111285 Transcript_38528/m.111285 type:complete len:259 (+) Transcript_38528:512-1288(+)
MILDGFSCEVLDVPCRLPKLVPGLLRGISIPAHLFPNAPIALVFFPFTQQPEALVRQVGRSRLARLLRGYGPELYFMAPLPEPLAQASKVLDVAVQLRAPQDHHASVAARSHACQGLPLHQVDPSLTALPLHRLKQVLVQLAGQAKPFLANLEGLDLTIATGAPPQHTDAPPTSHVRPRIGSRIHHPEAHTILRGVYSSGVNHWVCNLVPRPLATKRVPKGFELRLTSLCLKSILLQGCTHELSGDKKCLQHTIPQLR